MNEVGRYFILLRRVLVSGVAHWECEQEILSLFYVV